MADRRQHSLWVRVGVASAGGVFVVALLAGALADAVVGAPDRGLAGRVIVAALVAAPAALVALAIPSLWLAPLSRRLVMIGRAARKFASGDLRHRIGEPDPAELHDLAASLNTMAAQLSHQITQFRAQQNEQDAILRSMEGGVLAIDAELRILRINRIARKMLRVAHDDVRGRPLQQIVTDPAFRNFAADAIADPTRRMQDFTLQDAPGMQVRATSGALLDAEDEPVGAIILLTDISQLKRLESMRADFAANVSHELRTPITNIKGYAETLLDGTDHGPETQDRFLRVIARNADRLGAIVNDMLALTKLERADRSSLAAGPTSVKGILAAAINQVTPDAEAREIRIVVDAPDDLRALVNGRLAEQAVLNLLSNAVKYGSERATVTVTARPATLEGDAPAAEILVADEGPGIPPDHLARLFERFYRVDKARSRESGGTGLGLSIVKHIAIVHGGDIGVESELGVGTTFRLVFPASQPKDDPRPAAAPETLGGDPPGTGLQHTEATV